MDLGRGIDLLNETTKICNIFCFDLQNFHLEKDDSNLSANNEKRMLSPFLGS